MATTDITWIIKAQDQTKAAFGAIDSKLSGLQKSLRAVAGVAGLAGLTAGMASLARETVAFAGTIQDAADKLNVSGESLQVLKVLAEEAGGSFEGLQSALEFNNRLAVKAAQGNKAAAETFRRLGIDAQAFVSLGLEDRFQAIATQVAGLKDKEDQLTVTQLAFGKGAGELVGVLRQGPDAIAATRKELDQLNAVMSNEQLKKLDEWAERWDRFTAGLKGTTADALVGTIDLLDRLSVTLNDVIDVFKGGDYAEDFFSRIYQSAKKNLREAVTNPKDFFYPEAPAETASRGGGSGRPGGGRSIVSAPDVNSLAEATKKDKERIKSLQEMKSETELVFMAEFARNEGLRRQVILDEIATERLEARAQVEADLRQVLRDSMSPMEAYQEQLRRVYALLASGNLSAEGAKKALEAYAKAFDGNREILTKNEKMLADIKSATEGFARDFTDIFFDATQSVGDMFENLAKQIAKMILYENVAKPLVDAISGGIGSYFGGARAAGGPVAAGAAYLVGEKGPELFVPRSSGSIVPNGAMAATAVNVNFTVNSLDPTTAAGVILRNRDVITGIISRSTVRAGRRPRLA